MNTADSTIMVYLSARGSGRSNLCHMLATAMIHGVSLDRHQPPGAGRVERDARRTNGTAGPIR